MDNRFKFRAWILERKEMVEVNAIDSAGVISYTIDIDRWSRGARCTGRGRYILMQCTGLLATSSYRGDSEEDRLIFEGDVIQTTNGYIFSVVWCESTAEFGVVNKFGEPGARWYLGVDLEIIGNVHEHPELLAQAK